MKNTRCALPISAILLMVLATIAGAQENGSSVPPIAGTWTGTATWGNAPTRPVTVKILQPNGGKQIRGSIRASCSSGCKEYHFSTNIYARLVEGLPWKIEGVASYTNIFSYPYLTYSAPLTGTVAGSSDSRISATTGVFKSLLLGRKGADRIQLELLAPSSPCTPGETRLCPVGLVVDPTSTAASDGNGVIEPDEIVAVQPAWKNLDDTDHEVTSAASGLTGPDGATYTLLDLAARYGTIAPGATRNCEETPDCFSMFVTGGGTRPVPHWDASFSETPSTTDPPKVWKLHLGDSFADVPRSHQFYKKVETILHNGITSGCAAAQFCPEGSVTRAEAAIFIARGLSRGSPLPRLGFVGQNRTLNQYKCFASGRSLFRDVPPGAFFCKAVHYLASWGVTMDYCGPSLFCPNLVMTRGEMADLLARSIMVGTGPAVPQTYGPEPVTGSSYSCDPAGPALHFTDVTAADPFCKPVHFLWAKGVLNGCGTGRFCPTLTISRGEMAKILSNAFQLELYPTQSFGLDPTP